MSVIRLDRSGIVGSAVGKSSRRRLSRLSLGNLGWNSRLLKCSLLAAAAVVVSLPVVSIPASAESPLEALRQYNQRAEWADKFDATVQNLAAMNTSEPMLSPKTVDYIGKAIGEYYQIVQKGGWQQVTGGRPLLKIGVQDDRVVALRRRLMVSGDLDQNAGLSNTFDSYVDAAVRRFQVRNGLIPDGAVGEGTVKALNVPAAVRLRQLQVNLERVRAMSQDLPDSYVMVNIPAAQIEAVDHGQVHSRHTAVVGKVSRQTPILNSKIYQINFNPYWTVPVSIIRKDLIPKMKKDPQYLARNHIRIFDPKGEEVTWQQIDWNTEEATHYRFRQDPGADNSLGSVRINFHNTHQVYLHDTPSKSLFASDYRFDSSGCVRVQNVRELVSWLLQSTTPGWDREKVDEVIRSGEREDVDLKTNVPLFLTYVTAWANADGVVQFRDDIYNRDGLYTGFAADGSEVQASASH